MKKQIRYLGGWEIHEENSEEFALFLLTHGVDKAGFDFFRQVQSALEFRISNGFASKIIQHDSCGEEDVACDIKLPISDWLDHEVFFLTKDHFGMHKIGGKRPFDYQLPTCKNLKTPFQYLGSIDGGDPRFNWLGIEKLHISFPLNECNFGIYLDCSDELHPVIMNPETFSDAWFDSEMGEVKEIEFKELCYTSMREIDIEEYLDSDDIVLCGVPLWYQAPSVPRCPKSVKVMQYVCTMNSDSDIEVINKEDSANLPFIDECLCFGDWGHLFVFYSPESKVMHLSIQF